ncbi:MAG: hypothetical protein KKB70_10465 [Proteobacteria bacterium]|nr:hypothetical protein [Pseudomonadota bacterium]
MGNGNDSIICAAHDKCIGHTLELDENITELVKSAARDEAKKEILYFHNGKTTTMEGVCVAPIKQALLGFQRSWSAYRLATASIRPRLDEQESLEKDSRQIDLDVDRQIDDVNTVKTRQADYDDRLAETEIANARYTSIRADEGNRDVQQFHVLLYLLGLAVLGIAEVFLNYEFILQFIGIPAFAMGVTMTCGFALAGASHIHGTTVKCWKHYFGDHVHDGKGRKLTENIVGLVMVMTVFGFVYIIRYAYIAGQAMEMADVANVLGESAVGVLSPSRAAFTTLALNLLIWLGGAVWAFWAHDSNPEFVEAKKQKIYHDKRLNKLTKKHDAKNDTHNAKRAEGREKIQRKLRANRETYGVYFDMDMRVENQKRDIICLATNEMNRLLGVYATELFAVLSNNGVVKLLENDEPVTLDVLRSKTPEVEAVHVEKLINWS